MDMWGGESQENTNVFVVTRVCCSGEDAGLENQMASRILASSSQIRRKSGHLDRFAAKARCSPVVAKVIAKKKAKDNSKALRVQFPIGPVTWANPAPRQDMPAVDICSRHKCRPSSNKVEDTDHREKNSPFYFNKRIRSSSLYNGLVNFGVAFL